MAIDPKKYVVPPGSSIVEVDLDQEEFYHHGERLTEARAEELAKETLAEIRRRNLIPGRKSLTGGSVHSPRVQFRVSESVRDLAEKRAEEEGRSVSEIAREALIRYLAS